MTHNVRSILVFGLILAVLISACATTLVTSTWKDPSYQGKPRKIMVIGVAKSPLNKRIFEDEFVRQLKLRGTDAVASYTSMPELEQNDYESVIAAKMDEQSIDTVLITRLVSKKIVQTFVPGNVSFPPVNYDTCWDYYAYCSQAIASPGYMAEDEYAIMETNLYDADSENLIWSAASETEILGSDQDQIKSFIGVMVKAMAEQKLLGR